MTRPLPFVTVLLLALPLPVTAHESRPGYLELRETGSGTYLVLWQRPVDGEVELRVTPAFPDRCELMGAVAGPEARYTSLLRAELSCERGLHGERVGITGLEATTTRVLVRVYYADGAVETHLVRPVEPAVEVGRPAAAGRRPVAYTMLGIEHIVLGVDHLLFLLGLLLLVDGTAMLVKTVTAFTVANGLTLAVAALGYASVPTLPLNAVLALSILFLGPEIIRARRGETSLAIRRPWLVAFALGLLHGFGFASVLTESGLPAREIALALPTFALGLGMGQLAVVALVLLLARAFRTIEVRWPRWVEAIPVYAIGSLGALWTMERTLAMLEALV